MLNKKSFSKPSADSSQCKYERSLNSYNSNRNPKSKKMKFDSNSSINYLNSYETMFAVYGCMASLFTILLLSLICSSDTITSYLTNSSNLSHTLSLDGGQEFFSGKKRIKRYLEMNQSFRSLENDKKIFSAVNWRDLTELPGLSNEIESQEAESMDTVECEHIFSFLEQIENNSSSGETQSSYPGDKSNVNNSKSSNSAAEITRYNQKVCYYSQTCEGDWPSQIFLPLLLCHGVDMSDFSDYSASTKQSSGSEDIETENAKQEKKAAAPKSPIHSIVSSFIQLLKFILQLLIVPLTILVIITLLFLLFRLLATTADSYFSPALETLSFELGLPSRFAGATFLALGNGSPDLGSTRNAILLWSPSDFPGAGAAKMHGGGGGLGLALGNLTGGGMFVGTIVSGLILQSCGISGITCRFSLIRDMLMYLLSVTYVWRILSSGSVAKGDAKALLGMYGVYVTLVLLADVYYKRVTLKRLKQEEEEERAKRKKMRRESRRASKKESLRGKKAMDKVAEDEEMNEFANELAPFLENNHDSAPSSYGAATAAERNTHPRDRRLSTTDRVTMFMSNYDPLSVKFDFIAEESFDDDSGSNSATSSKSCGDTCNGGGVMNSDNNGNNDDLDVVERLEDAELETIRQISHQVNLNHYRASFYVKGPAAVVPTGAPDATSSDISLVEADKAASDSTAATNFEGETSFIASSVPTENAHTLEEGSTMMKNIEDAPDGKSINFPREWSKALFIDASQELLFQSQCFWKENFHHDGVSLLERVGSFLELPFTILRSITTPKPCEDHYSRALVALSTAMSPYWIIWYLDLIEGIDTFIILFCFAAFLVGLGILRYADDDKMPLVASVPLSLYGFFIAATWIDVIGDNLVAMLQFLGTISRIPAPILGLTVLAWGNSLGDLSANVAMARKGMPDMATTGCWAGPSFNLLVGLGLGFLSLQHQLHQDVISPVAISDTIKIGFLFIMANCLLAVICGLCCQRRIPPQYRYVFFTIYALFIFMSLRTLLV